MRQDFERFTRQDTIIISIGPDNAKKYRQYWEENGLPFIGLPDEKHTVLKRYGQEVKLFKFGRQPAQMIIDKEGLLRYVHYGHSMSDIPGNEDMLALLDELKLQHFSDRLLSHKIYDAILDSIISPIVFVDNTHTIKYLNKAARIRYYEKRGVSDLIGKSLFDCHNLISEKAIREIHARLQAGEDEVFLKVDQDQLKLTVVGVRDPDGKLIGYYERFENE